MKRFIIPCFLIQSNLFAATSATWISTSSSSMNTSGNWSPNGVPASGTPLIFPPGPSGIQFSVINDIGPFTLSAVSAAFPNSLSITNDGSTAYSISPSALANVFQVPSSSTAQIVFGSSSGSLASNLSVPINLNSGTLNLIGSAAYDQISGGITGSGTLQVVGGTVQLSGTNNYTGATNINAGTLRLGAGSALPSGTALTIASGGIFNLNGQNQTFTSTPTINTGGIVQTGAGTLTASGLSGSGIIAINTGGTLKIINTGTNTFSGQLITGASGAGGTFELGAGSTGTFILSGANAYSTQTTIGFTTVTAGTLQSGNPSAFGTQSNLTIASGATLDLNGNTATFNTLSGAGTFTLGAANATISSGSSNTFSGGVAATGSGQLIYAGSDLFTLTGSLNIPTLAISGGGTLNVANLSGITNSILFETANNGTLQFSTGLISTASTTLSTGNANFDTIGHTVTINGTISGGGSLTKLGSGILILGGSGNAYTGGTIVSQGTVQLSSATAYPVNGSTGTPLNIANSGTSTFDMQGYSITISALSGAGTLSMGAGTATVAVGGTTFSGPINGSGGLIYTGNATTLTLTGTNGYTGTTTISGTGTLNVVQSAFNTTTGLIFSGSGGTLQAGGSLTNSIPVTLSANGTIDTNGHASTFSGKITGSSTFTKQGAGTLTLNSMTSDYTGETNVFAGTLQAGSASAFGSTSALNIKTGATLDLNSNSISVAQLLGDTGSSLLLGTGTLTITGGASTAPFYGVISQSGNVILNGGQPTFIGTNTYTGMTTIQGGASFNTTTLNSTTGGVTFGTGGGTLTIGSNTSTSSNFTLNDVATIATNTFNLTITGTITGSAHSFTKLGSGILSLNPSSTNTFTSTPISMQGGTLEVTAKGLGTPVSITFQNFCGTLQIDEPLTISSPIVLSSIGTINTNGNAVTISGNITNPTAASGLPSGGLGKSGAGVLTLTGTNYYTAPTTIYSGTINAGSTSFPLPTMSFTPTLVFSGDGTGTFQAAGTFSSFPVIILNQSGTFDTNGNSMTLNNIIAGSSSSASLTKTGAGTLFLTAANLYTGMTIIENGTLNVISTSLPSTSGVEFNGTGNGILQAGGPMPSVGNSISFQQNGTIDTNGSNVTISGILSGVSGMSFTKAGTGTLTLSGPNTYPGPTIVSAGTLRAGVATGNSGAFGENSAVTVNSGATLDFSTYNNSVASIANNGTVLSSATITTGTFSQSSSGATTLNFPTSSASPVGNVAATGSISLNGGLTITSTGGYGGGSNVILFQSSGSGKQLTGAFTSTTLPFGSIHYDYSQNQVILAGGGATSCTASWNQAGNGNWAAMGDWTSTGAACTPGVSGNNNDSATLPTVGAGAVVITLANSGGTAAQDVTLQYLDLNSASTSYTIQQYMGAGTITMEDTQSTKPILHSVAGTHTINAPIILNQDARFMISAGTLTLGSQTTISSSTGAWNLSEGSGTGTLNNNGVIAPASLLIEGNTVENNATIHPTGALAISGLGGSSGATVNNHGTLSSGTTFLLGGSAGASTLSNDAGKTVSSLGAFTIGGGGGTTTLTNSGTVSSGSTLAINSGTVTNQSGALISSASTFTIAGGTVTNNQGATLGSSSADFVYTGGALTSSDQLLAKNYTQGSSATINLNFPTNAPSPVGNLSATGAVNLAGGLHVTSSYVPGGSAEVILFRSTGSGKELQGTFSTTSLPAGTTLHYDYSENQVVLAFAAGCDGTWQSASNGNWGLMSNWTSCVPGTGAASNNDTATFPTVGAAAVAVTLANAAGSGVQNITLHDLTFDSASTSYTIEQYMSMGTLTMAGTLTSKPRVTVNAGNHIINVPIALPQNVRFTLNSGSLTLGVNSSITSSPGFTWYLSEGSSGGALNNHGTISPTNVWIEGNVLNNAGAITPSGTFTLQGLGGIAAAATLNNSTTLSSGGAFLVGGGAGPTLLNNSGTVTAGTTFTVGGGSGETIVNNTGSISSAATVTILSGTVNNNSGSTITAASGSTFTISGGIVTNNTNAALGSSTANMVFNGGTLITAGNVLAESYTQSGTATLETLVSSLSSFGNVAASAAGTLGGNLIVYAEPGISLVHGDTINLLTAAGGRSSQFASVSFQNFPSSLIPSIVYLNNAVQLDIRGTNPTPVHGSRASTVFNSISQHNSFVTLQMMHMRDRMRQPTESIASRFLPYSIDELVAENAEIEAAAGIEAEVIAQQPGIIQKTAQLSERVEKEGFPSSLYAGPIASFGNVKTKGAQLGLGYASAGGLAGFDTLVEDIETRGCRAGIGAIAEYRKIWSTINAGGGSTSTDHVHGSLYATAIPKSMPNLAVEGIVGFAFNWDHIVRHTGIDLTSTAIGSTTEMIGDALLGFEYTLSGDERTWLPCNFTIIPLMTWQYVVDRVSSYTESGAGIYDLHYDPYIPMSLNSVLGARFQYLFRGSNANVRLEIDAGWQHEYLNRAFAVTATAFTITTGAFTTNTVAPGRNSLVAAIDLLAICNGGWTIEANSTYQLNSLYYDLFFYLGFGREF